MKTPRQSVIQEMHPGQYIHFGFKSAFIALLEKEEGRNLGTVKLDLNVDGLPLFKSSKDSLWPILISIVSKQPVAVVGGYYGPSKPNVHVYLQKFIDEYNHFNTHGIEFREKTYFPVIDILCCDAPAKCYVLCVKGHTGYSSCIKCKTEGIYKNNRLCFPDLEVTSPLRSDEEYRSNVDDFHNAISPLAQLNQFNFIDNIPFDYMHLVCLGIMKKLILLWHQSKLPCSLQPRKILEISQNLEIYRKFCPSEFARKPRSLDYFKIWKATEYRQFLLYTGFGALENIVTHEIFQSFLGFLISMRIFTSDDSDLYSYGKEMVIYFLKTFKILYGEHNMTHNVHALLHLHNDVIQHGPVDKFSAFKFENELFQLKKLVHTTTNPLQQIYNRVNELGQNRQYAQVEDGVFPNSEHTEGPVLDGMVQTKQYHRAVFEGLKIDTKKRGDQVFGLHCGSIVKIVNICVDTNGNITILFKKMLKENLFETPCPSENVGLYKLSAPRMKIEQAAIEKIHRKFYCYPRSNSEEFIAAALQGNNK
uniref:Transposase domain-containing protein n=1 Tax=Cacopsylla melanoneura TaxID=428564 RepID=A0A8D8SGN3_9HEMI